MTTIVDARNLDRLRWAVRVRWLAIAGFLSLALLSHPFGLFPRVQACVWAAALGAVLNGVNHLVVRSGRGVVAVTLIAVPMDHVLTTTVVLYSGGVQSPFLLLYCVQVVTTAMLVTFHAAALSVVLGVFAFGLVFTFARDGVAPLGAPALAADAEALAEVTGAAWLLFLLYCLLLLIFVGGYVSERLRRSEAELEEKNRCLERSVASLAHARDALEDAYRRLQCAEAQLIQSEKMRALGQLVAGVAHELNNPLSFLSANVAHLRTYSERLAATLEEARRRLRSDNGHSEFEDLCQRSEIDVIAADLPEVLDDCAEGVRRANQIVGDLHEFASGRSVAGADRVDVNRGLASTAALLRGRFRGKVAVHFDLEPVPECRGSAGQLNQVFLNLLLNAADAVEAGGEIWIASRFDPSEGQIVVRIRDSGVGIDPACIDRIFEPFYTTKPVGKGTGLGLSISYGIVERHGGSMRAWSFPGAGATFEIRLPADGPGG